MRNEKRLPRPGSLVSPHGAVHELDELAADRQPEPGTAELARHAAIGLLERLRRCALCSSGATPTPGIGDGEFQDRFRLLSPGRRPRLTIRRLIP
jgi:hypothetical protein